MSATSATAGGIPSSGGSAKATSPPLARQTRRRPRTPSGASAHGTASTSRGWLHSGARRSSTCGALLAAVCMAHARTPARTPARTHARTHTHKQARTRTRTYACICRPLHAAPRAAAPRRAPPPRALPPLRLTGGGGAPPRSIAPRPDGACPPCCRHRCPARSRRRRPCAPYRGYCSRVAPGGRRRHGEPHAGPRGPGPPLGVHRLCRHAAGSRQRGRALARATTAASCVFAASRVRP